MNLVTGASGLLGSHVILELLKKNVPVRAMVRSSHHEHELRDLAIHYGMDPSLIDRIEWVSGDVLDITSLNECMQGCQVVYHCAAVVSYHSKDRNQMYQVNVEGTANVVNVALEHGNIRLCFVSSIAAIGKAKNNDRLDENTAWVDSPFNTHYAITKNLAELEVWRAMHEGLQGVIVNPGFIIGPGNFDRSSPSVFKKLDEGLSYYPPGVTGFIGARDVAGIMVTLMEKEIFGERFILVAENLTMKEIFQSIAAQLKIAIPEKEATPFILELARWGEALRELFTGRKALVTKESVRNASVRFFYDHEKIAAALPVTFTPIADAVADTARYFLSKKNTLTR
jgi:dihydroflavonol-4-reductase